MKKILKNKPRLIFGISFCVIVILTIVGVIIGLEENESVVVQESSQNKVVELTQQEIKENLDTVSVNGLVETIKQDSIVVRVEDKTFEYKITEDTIFTKGVMAEKTDWTGIKIGLEVSLQISESKNNVISIWWRA